MRSTVGRAVVLVEVALAVAAVLLDLLLPTLVLLALAGVSLAVRHQGPGTLGLGRPRGLARQVLPILALVVVWTVVQLALVIPMLEHLTGDRQDVTGFAEIEGNLGLLVVLLVLSWTLAAVGEEAAYRGYVRTRIVDLLGAGRLGATFFDGLFFCALVSLFPSRVWAAVLAHGLNNTIGLTAYFLVGPVYGLW